MLPAIKDKIRHHFGTPGRLTALSGYFALATAMFVGLYSVPLAFRFVSKEEFGIWNVLGQTLGFLLLIDFGVSAAASRILAEPMQAGDRDELDSWWTVLVAVLGAQAAIILGVGLLFERTILGHFPIPPELYGDASLLWRTLIVVTALKNPFQGLTGVLFCQNRLYHMHLGNALGGIANLALFYVLLRAGWGLKAYVGAVVLSTFCMVAYWYLAVRRSGLKLHLRPAGFSTAKLKSLYSYSGSIFLLAMAAQVALASQTMIVGSVLGMAAVSSFAVSQKSFTVLSQLLNRTVDAKTPRWLQLHVEGRGGEIAGEWKRLMRWFTPIVFFCAAGLLVFNRSFVGLYVAPEMHEGRLFDLLLAGTLVVQQLARPLIFMFLMARKTWGLSVVAVIDAATQFGLACLFVRWWGPAGILLGALIGMLLTSTPFVLLFSPALLHQKRRTLFPGMLADLFTGLGVGAAVWFLLPRFPTGSDWLPLPMEWLAAVASAVLAVWGFMRLVATGLIRLRTH
jgi:O-antigen/teichoic acid export membrane protein